MKLAVSSFAWPPERAADAAGLLGELPAVQGVELVLPMSFPIPAQASYAEVKKCRRMYELNGLSVVSVQSLAYGMPQLQLLGDADVRSHFLDHLERMAVLAKDLGASIMVFGSPANRRRGDMPFQEALDIATDLFQRLGDRLVPTGVVVCIEPNPPIYANCDFLLRTEETMALVERVAHPHVKLQLDTGAIVFAQREGHDLEEADFLAALNRAGHVHVSVPGLSPVRHSDTEQVELASRIRQADPPWVSIEMMHGGAPNPFSAIREAVEAVCDWYAIRSSE